MSTQNIVRVTIEWSEDHKPSTLIEVQQLSKDGWELPHISDFRDAKDANLQDFKCPDKGYWAFGHHFGDVSSIIPRTCASKVINSYTEKRRFRLIRKRVQVKRNKKK